MAAVIGALRADLSASVAQFEADMGRAAAAVRTFGRQAAAVSRNLENAGARMTMAITAPFIALAITSAKAAAESRDAIAQVESRLASMGNASGRTSEQLQAAARQLQGLSTYDDDDILRNVTNAMLTFGNVSGEQFDRAQRAALDMATSMKTDLQSAAIRIGKALNNPIKGITALTRVGVEFTDQQKAQIKALVKSGDILAAQGMILRELEREFAGAAKAAQDAKPGDKAIDAWREFQETVGEAFLRIVEKVEPFVTKILEAFTNLSPGMADFIVGVGLVVAALGPLLWVMGAFAGAVANLAPLWAAVVEGFTGAMAAAGITEISVAFGALMRTLAPWVGLIATVVMAVWEFRAVIFDAFGGVIAYFQANVFPAFQRLFDALGGLFTEISSGPIGEFVRFVGWALAEVLGFFVSILGTAVGAVIVGFVDLLTGLVKIIGHIVGAIGDILTGDFAGAWEHAQGAVGEFADGTQGILEGMLPGVTSAVQALWETLNEWIAVKCAEILDWIEARFPGLVKAVYDAAIGAAVWAKRLYEGIRTWLVDKLGPLIQWAKDRIRELNDLFATVSRRQAEIVARGAPKPAAKPKPAPPAAAPPPSPGGGPGGSSRRGSGGADRAADNLKRATAKFNEALEDVNDSIDQAFDRAALPKATVKANALREKLAEMAEEARAAGVDMDKFAASIALANARIDQMELEGLQREADEFARDVRESTRDVDDLVDGLTPLEERLQDVDHAYVALREKIVAEIEANRALAESNDAAAASMLRLEAQLKRLDEAHTSATEAAKAQYAAEQNLANLKAAQTAGETQGEIDDLKRSRGDSGFESEGMRELRELEEELQARRIENQVALAELEMQLQEAKVAGDTEEQARLETQIGLQRELGVLLDETTAQQIRMQETLQSSFDEIVGSLADGAAQLVTDWEGGVKRLKQSFAKMIADLIIKLAMLQLQKAGIPGFGGQFAAGGTLAAGQWGIAGEHGPEPIYAGSRPLHVMSNEDATRRGGGVYVDARGAGPREVDELKRWARDWERNFDSRVIDSANEGIMRKKIGPPAFG